MLSWLQQLFKKGYDDCNGEEFKARYLKASNAVLLDVRSASEFKDGTIEGAINSNMMSPAFSVAMGKMDSTKTYFVFCRSGARSAMAADRMSKFGLKVINLKGGISAWPQ